MAKKPLVSICCITYNHEKFIREAIEGFLMQETDFLIEVIIHDDASTDNTQDIIREYSETDNRIIPILRENNIKSTGVHVLPFTYEKASGKYIAICEGDDYWTDPLKLQKQVEFMEKNPDYGLVYTKAKIFIQKEQKLSDETVGEFRKDTRDFILRGNGIVIPTVLFRKNLYKEYNEFINKHVPISNWLVGDLPLWLYITQVSKFYFIDEVTCVYRILRNSASHFYKDIKGSVEFVASITDISIYFSKHFNLGMKNKIISRYITFIAFAYARNQISKQERDQYFDRFEGNSLKSKLVKFAVQTRLGCYFFKKAHNIYGIFNSN